MKESLVAKFDRHPAGQAPTGESMAYALLHGGIRLPPASRAPRRGLDGRLQRHFRIEQDHGIRVVAR